MKSIIYPIVSGVLLWLAACGSSGENDATEEIPATPATDTSITADTVSATTHRNDTVTIIGVGDIMLGTNYPSAAYLPPNNDCKALLSNVAPVLRSADVTFGNIEGVFLDSGGTVKRCSDPSVCYAFRMPSAYFQCIADAGFDVLSLANNHTGDFGPEGRQNTVQLIENAGLVHAGLLTAPSGVFEHNGRRYGLCAFAPNTGTCDLRDIPEVQRIVAGLDTVCDVVIVSFHGGAEGRGAQHVNRQTERYVGENRGNVYEFARHVIDAGADVVFGHGPHVTRAVDVYRERFIAYSLGNFATYSRISLRGESGIAPIIKVFTDSTGRFLKAEITPTYQTKGYGPRIDTLRRAIELIRELTTADFPESPLTISADGEIRRTGN